jgi:hypothetical protein
VGDDVSESKPEGGSGFDALANLVKHFIVRDVIYAIGGGVLILSLTYAFGDLRGELTYLKDAPTVVSLLLAGVAWAVGYAMSDGMGGIIPACWPKAWQPRLWPFVKTDYIGHVRRLPKRLFESFAQEEWRWNPTEPAGRTETPATARDALPVIDHRRAVAADLIAQEFGSYHRTVLLRHLGSAIGACGLFAGALAFYGAWKHDNPLARAFAVGAVFVSCVLLAIGWVKALQQMNEINKEAQKRQADTTASELASIGDLLLSRVHQLDQVSKGLSHYDEALKVLSDPLKTATTALREEIRRHKA